MIKELYNVDCIQWMRENIGRSVNLTLTDIPYNAVSRDDNGLRNLDMGCADILTFDLNEFLNLIYEITSGTIIIFCGKEQLSPIYKFFDGKAKDKCGTVRQLIWHKSNPSPMNGQYVYLSGIENAVWFKKRGGVFNAHCKNTVFKYPKGRARYCPTEKNSELIRELILDNSNVGDTIFDPCFGSGTHLLVSAQENRGFIGCEINKEYYETAIKRLKEWSNDV